MIALYLWLGRTKGLLCFIAGWIYDINHSSFTTQNLKGLHKNRESDGHRLIRKGGIFFLFFWCFLLLYISLNTFIHPYISLQYKTPAIFPWLNLEERKQKKDKHQNLVKVNIWKYDYIQYLQRKLLLLWKYACLPLKHLPPFRGTKREY